ncbi:MAG: hypothetical protein KatS3mg023_3745 [Armatimonadota bacterium]|jgi:Holliday junction resolvase|nr:MAG: hypothetical protein KatS3mg023_3745 [Armatimonadota bacterium]
MSRNSGLAFERELLASASSCEHLVLVKIPVGYSPLKRFAGGGYADMVGNLHGIAIAIEAKSCRGGRFSLGRITDKQLDFLLKWQQAGGYAFVLLRYGYRNVRLVVIDVRQLLAWKAKGKKGISERDIQYLPCIPRRGARWCMEALYSIIQEDVDGHKRFERQDSQAGVTGEAR